MQGPEGSENIVEISWKYKKLDTWCDKLQEKALRWQGKSFQACLFKKMQGLRDEIFTQ